MEGAGLSTPQSFILSEADPLPVCRQIHRVNEQALVCLSNK